MKVVALVSGGKDSCYNMLQSVLEGHTITALGNLYPVEKDELDSYMFQTVGHHAIDLYAEAMGVPLYRRPIKGGSVQKEKDYTVTPSDEVEDLYELLKEVKEALGVEAVSVGAILSDYQRVRVEHVCSRLGLVPLAFLWRRDQEELLNEMILCGVHAIIIKVAALGLTPEHLGKSLKDIQPHMLKMKKLYSLNECGEGGEYETLTLDCPLFKKRIVIDKMDVITHSNDAFAPVAYLNFIEMHVEDKDIHDYSDEKISKLPAKNSNSLFEELFKDEGDRRSMKGVQEKESVIIKPNENYNDFFPSKIYTSENSLFVRLSNVKYDKELNDVGSATAIIMDILGAKLADFGLSFTHLVAVHIYVRDMTQFAKINAVYKKYFEINPPIRVCVEAHLPDNIPLLLDCVAYRGDIEKHTMHVQGLSHWAPANIGPYSQAALVGNNIYIAGQIALCPATMNLISGGIIPQSRLSLRHVERVLRAMSSSCSLSFITMGICYVTHQDYIEYANAEWQRAVEREDTSVDIKPLMFYIVVPALPRNALVEWQITAMTEISDRKQVEEVRRGEYYTVKAIQQIISSDNKYLLKACYSIQTDIEFIVHPAVLEDIWGKIKDLVKEMFSKIESSFYDMPSPRVFYVASLVRGSALLNSFENVMFDTDSFKGNLMAPALVPIVGHKQLNTLFSVCL